MVNAVGLYKTLRVSCLILTVLLFAGHYYLPERRTLIYPTATGTTNIYGFIDSVVGKSSSWLDQAAGEWECTYKPNHHFGCGWDITWDEHFVQGLDLTIYDGLELSMDYSGSATRARIYLKNYNKEYAKPGDAASAKFISMTFPITEAQGSVRVRWSEFSVASWWLMEWNIRRRWSLPEFDNITQIGVDYIEPGYHKTRIKQIALFGQWVRTENLLYFILGFWMAVFLVEGFVRFSQLYRKTARERMVIYELEKMQFNLEEEKAALRELADKDPLTGIFNRGGMESYLRKVFSTRDARMSFGLMLLDIDHFKRLNDTYGHDFGDRVLKTFTLAISNKLREEDLFARWGGEEFIVFNQSKSIESLLNLAEKLREITAACVFPEQEGLTITISVGLTMGYGSDTFEEAFKRADNALYRAKKTGRNRVEYES